MEVPNIEELRSRYIAERESYEHLSGLVEERLKSLTRTAGIPCGIHSRAKEVSSFLKKVLKGKYSNPYDEIKDKAGVRVVAHYPWDVKGIEELIQQEFIVVHYEDKRAALPFQMLDYRGTHYEIKYREELSESRDLICEIQVLTRAESLWADTAHYLSYKPVQPPSYRVQRAVYRLIALIEIFDSEMEHAYNALRSDAGYEEASLLLVLEQHYLQFAAKQGDRELSLRMLSLLREVVHASVLEQFESSMQDYVSANKDKLVEFYERYQEDDSANPLIWQPETLLVFFQLEADPFKLRDVWQDEFPDELLVSLSNTWGAPI